MTTVYPGALDTLDNPVDPETLADADHSGLHADASDALEAIQATLGINPQGAEADLDARLAALETLAAGLGTGLEYTVVGVASSPTSGTTITLNVPGAIQNGDLMIVAAAGHNRTVGAPSGGGWDTRMSYDTDGQEPIYCYTKLASSQGSTITLSVNSSTTNLAGAVLVVLRGPTTFVSANVSDATNLLARPNGRPNGVVIGVWVSALAAGTGFNPGMARHHITYRTAVSEPAFMVCSDITTHDGQIPQYNNVHANGISGSWLGNVVMIWE